jgi:VWFA-related protein
MRRGFLAILTTGLILAAGMASAIRTIRAAGMHAQNAGSQAAQNYASRATAAPNMPSAEHSSQTPSTSPAAAPQTLKAATRLVEVSVIVKDKHGDPVRDLTSADFVIRDKKQVQEIRFFRVETNDPPANSAQPLPPDSYTNRPQDFGGVPPSVTMILLDGLNTQFSDQAIARAQVVNFLKQIRPQDHVALYVLGRDLRVIHDFTTDSSRLVSSLSKSTAPTTGDLDASTPQDVQTGNDEIDSLMQTAFQNEANFYIQDRVHMTVEALTAIAEHTGPLPGRKNLVWVSGSFPFSVGYENVDDLLNNTNNPTNEQLLFAEDIEKAARALNDADIAVYPVDARGLLGLDMGTSKSSNHLPAQGPTGSATTTRTGNTGGMPGSGGGRAGGGGPRSRPPTPSAANVRPASPIQSPDKTNFETMDTLADRTGGKAFYNTNDIFGAIRRAVDDSSLTYELGYYPEDVKWDGSFRTIEIEAKRPGVQVRARKGYFALPEPKSTPEARRDAAREATTSSMDPAQIAMAVHASAANVPGARTITLAIHFDVHAIEFEQKDGRWAGTIETVVVQRDSYGKVLTGVQETFRLNYPEDRYQQILRDGAGYTKDFPVNPKAADIRAIVRDAASGRIGAVAIPLAKYFRQTQSAN